MGAKLAQMQTLFAERGEDARHRGVHLGDGKLVYARVHAMRLNAGNGGEQRGIYTAVARCAAGHGEFDNVVAAYRGNQLLRRSQGNDPAVVHDGDPVAEALRFVHVMRGEDDGSTGVLQLVDEIPEVTAGLGIEAGGGLVKKQQLGIADQGAGHGQALLLPAGEPADARAALLFQLRLLSGLIQR